MKSIIQPIKQIKSWSFSRYSDYKQCPAKAKYKHIDGMKEPTNEAMQRGSNIHKLAENYIKGAGRQIPKELALFRDEFRALRAQYKELSDRMMVEDNWAFTKDWGITRWDNWADCWLRVKLDCAHYIADGVLVVTDWKTGKFRAEMNAEYLEQLELYALAAMYLDESIQEVRPRLVYLDVGIIYPGADEDIVYLRKDLPQLKKLWDKRIKPMLTDTVFQPRPNDKCRWCHFSASKDGPCKY